MATASILSLLAGCRSSPACPVPDPAPARRTVGISLRLVSAETKLSCEHGEDHDSEGYRMIEPGTSFEIRHDVRVRDVTDADGSRFARSFLEDSLELVKRAPDGTEASRHALVGPDAEQPVVFRRSAGPRPEWVSQASEGEYVADLLGSWITEADGAPEQLVRFVGWLNAGGLSFPGYGERDPDEWPSVHIAIVPGLPPWPDSWMAALRGSVVAEPGAAPGHHAITFALEGETPLVPVLERALAGIDGSHELIHEVLDYEGSVRWTCTGAGEIVRGDEGVERVQLRGDLGITYDLRWSYAWEVPRVEQLSGRRTEHWSGELAVSGRAD